MNKSLTLSITAVILSGITATVLVCTIALSNISTPGSVQALAGLNQNNDQFTQLVSRISSLDQKVGQILASKSVSLSSSPAVQSTGTVTESVDYDAATSEIFPSDDASWLARDETGQLPKMVLVNPTPEQQQVFEELKQRIDDPTFTRDLRMAELANDPDMQLLPGPLRMVVLSKAIDKFNQGEIDEETFLSITPRAE